MAKKASKAGSQKLEVASVLAFERKLNNSDGMMVSCQWESRADRSTWRPLELVEKSVRGTISNRQKANIANDPAKLDAETCKANLQRVDSCAIPFDQDTMGVVYTLRVLGNLNQPSVCNDQNYQKALVSVINGYTAEHGFTELANRYAQNIANGRFLWRNRVGAENVEVHVTHKDKRWVFVSADYSLRSFETPTGDLAELAAVIREGLAGNSHAFLEVVAFAQLGEGQEVYPSQELVLDETGKSKKSKILYHRNGQAGMHSQKLGNALRSIDTWYPVEAGEELLPIAAEPFGSVTSQGKAYRNSSDKTDLYTLFDDWVIKAKAPKAEDQHYVMACLIRGGVYGESKKEKTDATEVTGA